MFAHEEDTDLDLDDGEKLLQALASVACPDKVADSPLNERPVVIDVLTATSEFLEARSNSSALATARRLVARLIRGQPADVNALYGRHAPRREAQLYRHEDPIQRGRLAAEVLDNLLKVVEALTPQYAEAVDVAVIRSDETIGRWLAGPWANCFAALRAARKLLSQMCPQSVEALDGKQAFRELRPWRELWCQFPELGRPESPSSEFRDVPKRKIAGREFSELDLDTILAEGSSGEIGSALVDAVDQTLDITAFSKLDRPAVDAPRKGKRQRKGGGGGGGKSSQKERERIGLLGEAFVYETFRVRLTDFDHTCWRSANRQNYGLSGAGDDGLGYDFLYSDVDGMLTGRTDSPICLLEVKATSGESKDAFPMTENEWFVAEECYKGHRDAVYVIVRVTNVMHAPRIDDVLVDPVRLWQEGRLALANHDWLIRTANVAGGVSNESKESQTK